MFAGGVIVEALLRLGLFLALGEVLILLLGQLVVAHQLGVLLFVFSGAASMPSLILGDASIEIDYVGLPGSEFRW